MIYNDLNESTYEFNYENYTFYFSSKFYLDKFKNEYLEYIKNETLKLEIKYKIKFKNILFLMISLYKKIEKRGFRIEIDNVEINDFYFESNIVMR